MMIINLETWVEILRKLAGPSTRSEGTDMLKKMLEIKQAHLWRSEVIAPCCGSLGGFACQLSEETELLEKAIALIENGEMTEARPMLDRLTVLISNGMGLKETPDLIEGLTAPPKQTPA